MQVLYFQFVSTLTTMVMLSEVVSWGFFGVVSSTGKILIMGKGQISDFQLEG